jgi:peptidoglycan hydrolase-like protein with peptidoglycan-binding domain
MYDPMVYKAQLFINSYDVSGIPKVTEDGETKWANMYALTRILQHELGITALSDTFGPLTMSTLTGKYPLLTQQSQAPLAVVKIVQSAMYCKGYNAGGLDGIYGAGLEAGLTELKINMGILTAVPIGLNPKIFKALLTMDAYEAIGSGTEAVRTVQQWLNSRYLSRANFFIIPCDGSFSRDVQKAHVSAIQYELGMSDSSVDGVFGPKTRTAIATKTVSSGSSGIWVQLFSAAMLFNRRAGVTFTSSFSSALASAVGAFQSFACLPVTKKGDYATWASLIVSNGDYLRKGQACDCITTVTAANVGTLKAAGFKVVGRYLCNYPGSILNKMIQPGELAVIASNGLSVFPIYETWGGDAGYYNERQGLTDGYAANDWATFHGFRDGTRIYFAIDFDALDSEVTSSIIPHFVGIAKAFEKCSSTYKVGVYGPRNVCSRVAAAGLSSASFVAGMSTAFSGNLGFPLPADWAFDQISTVSKGSGTAAITVDNDILSGKDLGQNTFNSSTPDVRADRDFDYTLRDQLLGDMQTYLNSIGVPEWSVGALRSISDAMTLVLAQDSVITAASNRFKIRKALIQAPLLWEARQLILQDLGTDALVENHYNMGAPGLNDCSTGLGQIKAASAIRAMNYCITNGIISGVRRDPELESDLGPVWFKLHDDDAYNSDTVPLLHFWDAGELKVPWPTYHTTDGSVEMLLAKYNGSGKDAEGYGQKTLGVYQVFEKYNKIVRSK